jgi:hypothetical protein
MKRHSPLWPVVILSASWFAAASLVGEARAELVQPFPVRAVDPTIERERTYLIGSGASVEDAVALRDRLIAAGARNVNLFVPAMVIVCDLPVGAAVEMPATFRSEPSQQVKALQSGTGSWGWIVDAYRTIDRMKSEPAAASAALPVPGEDFQDVVLTISPERAREARREVEKSRALQGLAPAAQPALNIGQTSEFLGGLVLANFILPESDGTLGGQSENWSDEDVTSAKQGAVEAMLSWQGLAVTMNLDFTFNFGLDANRNETFVRAPCGYEPIDFAMDSDPIWIMDTMHKLGYGLHTSDVIAAVHEFNELERARWHTQWVFTAFIANSRNVPTHRFGGGDAPYTAYAYLGGPFMVEPHPAGTDPNGVGERLVYSQIVNHEVGHNFWTLDEYPGSPGICTETSGYLAYSNGNQTMTGPGGEESRCNPLVECIMHSAARKDIFPRPWCHWSLGHLGIIDNDGSGRPDIFEARPEIIFQAAGPETVTTNEYTLRFKVRARAVPNRNPRIAPADRVNYAAPLADGWISIGQTSRILLDPLDGRWNEVEEDCEFRVQVPMTGQFVFTVMAENSVGYASTPTKKVIYFAGINYARTALTVRTSRIDISWETVPDPFGAKFNVYRLEPGEEFVVVPDEPLPGRRLNVDYVPPQTTGGAFVPYRFIDTDVVPGRDYRYYIEGAFTLPYGNGTRDYSSLSHVVAQTAMIPMVDAEVISNVAPNPSRGAVTVSVRVPPTYGGTERAPIRLATSVEIAVYNVRGQLVRSLKSGGEFSDIVTVHWDGNDSRNRPAPSGVYFVRAVAGVNEASQKIVLIR